MSSNTEGHDPVDWGRYEAEVGGEVVDLDAARAGRAPDVYRDIPADTYPDTDADMAPDTGADGPGRRFVDSVAAQRRTRLTVAGLKAGQRRPIIPAWLKSKQELVDGAKWAAGHVGHVGAYHATRLPKYVGKLTVRAPRGAGRIVTGYFRWLFDWEGEPVRQAMARREDPEHYLKLSRQRDMRVRWRGIVAAITVALVLLAVGGLLIAPPVTRWAVLAGLVAVLGVLGRPGDKPLLDTAVVVPRVARLTSEVVVRSLSVLGIAGISQALAKNSRAINFPAEITRDGPGWRADVDLPYGVTAGEVMERRDKLASGLGRPLGCVWPEANHEISPARLTIWVGDHDLATSPKPTWPLAKAGTVDLFRPFPFGTDPRGRNVPLELAYTNVLIGSIPGAGKTFSLRLPLLAAALDPRAELWTFELKGTGDLEPLAKVSARYGSGPDDDIVEEALFALRDLRKECSRRAATIKGLPKSVCPENKVTSELASRKSLRLHPLVVGIDECQDLFSHSEFGKEAGELAEKVIKLGRALGIVLLLATQRPDARSLPTGVTANVGTRFCLKVMGQMENDMILGTSMYKNGIRASMFTLRDKGVGYLVGASDDPQITRTYYVDSPAAELITTRARAMREATGTLTGHAIGQTTDTPASRRDSLLDDVLAVVPAGEPKVWNETVLARLTELRPDTYTGWKAEQLTAALKPHGIGTGQVWGTDPDTGKGANRRGIERDHITEAVTERNRRKGNPPAA